MRKFKHVILICLFITFSCKAQKTGKSAYSFCNEDGTFNTHSLTDTPSKSEIENICACFIDLSKDTLAWTLLKDFPNIEYLEILTLSGRKAVFSPSVCQLKNLKTITFRGYKTILPFCFFELEKLETLNLAWTQFNSIPPEIYNLPNLEKLYLGKYQGIVLTEEINRLEKLTELTIQLSKINSFPKPIYELLNLSALSIVTNRIIELENDLIILSKLKFLEVNILLNDTDINVLSKLPNLECLSINKLNASENLKKLAFLKELRIRKKVNSTEAERLRKLLPNTKIIFYS